MKESEHTMTTPAQPSTLAQIAKTNKAVAPTAAQSAAAGTTAPKTTHNSDASVKGMIMSMVSSLETIKGEREHIGDIAGKLKAEHQIEPKVSRKTATIIHKGDRTKDEEFQDAVNRLVALVSK